MKRLHVHVGVTDLDRSIGFYSALFAAKPTVVKPDYAKWMLDDPRVNFAISTRGKEAGLDHLGIQVEDASELSEVYARLRDAGGNIIEQGETVCCYATSQKSWIDDPAGIAWETFLTTGESVNYGDGTGENSARVVHEKTDAKTDAKTDGMTGEKADACCAPKPRPESKPAATTSACCG